MILDRAESTGGHALAVLELSECAVGYAGLGGERAAVPHAKRGAPRNDVVAAPLPVLTSHNHIIPEEIGRIYRAIPPHSCTYMIKPYSRFRSYNTHFSA